MHEIKLKKIVLAKSMNRFKRKYLITYSQTISCCNSVDKFVGGSGTHVIIVLIIASAFILANGCWPVAISSYMKQMITYLSKLKGIFIYCWKTQCPHVWSNTITFRRLSCIDSFGLKIIFNCFKNKLKKNFFLYTAK